MPNARDLRLQADYEHLITLAQNSGGTLQIESTQGRPADQYVLVFKCRSIEAVNAGKSVYRDLHRVRIKLPAKYPVPSAPPVVDILTPIFHPHVYPNRTVCIGSWATTEYLEDFVLRLGALLQFDRQFLNVKDPANPDAMAWVQKNLLLLPTDTCTFQAAASPTKAASEEQAVPLEWQEI